MFVKLHWIFLLLFKKLKSYVSNIPGSKSLAHFKLLLSRKISVTPRACVTIHTLVFLALCPVIMLVNYSMSAVRVSSLNK
jgi:hypothetical protein